MKAYLYKVISILVFATIFLFYFTKSMTSWENHDENQFIASGKILLQEGKWPIVDYAYYHQPAYSVILAILFQFSPLLMITGRIFSILSFLVILILLWRFGSKNHTIHWRDPSLYIPLITILLLAFSHGGQFTFIGWDHVFPIMLITFSMVSIIQGYETGTVRPIILAGLCFAFAVACRASFAPLVMVFFPAVVFVAFRKNLGFKAILLFIGACVVGALPVFITMIANPEEFIFDSLVFHSDVDVRYLSDVGNSLTIKQRLDKIYFNMITSSNKYLVICALTLIILYFTQKRTERKNDFGFILILALFLGFNFIAVMKNVTFDQYFIGQVITLCFLVSILLQSLSGRSLKIGLAVAVLSFIGAFIIQGPEYSKQMHVLFKPSKWRTYNIHQEGLFIRDKIGDNPNFRVLTLSPMYCMEGDCRIYDNFVSSPFAYRTAKWVDKKDFESRHLVSDKTVDSFMLAEKPAAIYTGHEGWLDDKFNQFAEKQGYEKIITPLGKTLYLRPGL